jgi:DNA-directed RNA polymerase subunit RPC12/RpoP
MALDYMTFTYICTYCNTENEFWYQIRDHDLKECKHCGSKMYSDQMVEVAIERQNNDPFGYNYQPPKPRHRNGM